MNDWDIAAYVWPAYHDEPRWRDFMPEGIGEWQSVRKALPRFPGHRQPRVPVWGYEDEADPRVMERKIAAAADHHVNVLIFDWYWYDGRPFLEEALARGFLGAANHDRLRFYLMWANHDATTGWDLRRADHPEVVWPGAVDRKTFDAAIEHVVNCFLTHPCYYKINGCPVFSVYEVGTLIKGLGGVEATRAALDHFRARVRAAGFPDLHLQGILWGALPAGLSNVPGDTTKTQDHTVRALGFNSLTNYQWCHYVTPIGDYKPWGEKAVGAWERWRGEFSVPFFPHVSIGWDSNPRSNTLQKTTIVNEAPQLFTDFLKQARAYVERHQLNPRLITVNAWNEWCEGSYLEPDTHFGMQYLEAVREVFGQA